MQIHVKSGRETYIEQVLKAYQQLYPKHYKWLKSQLRKLGEVQSNTDGSFVDKKGRVAKISFRVPTVLWLFLKAKVPDWGDDPEDIIMLQKVAKDFLFSDRRRVKRVWGQVGQKKEDKTGGEKENSVVSSGAGEKLQGLPPAARWEL